MIRRPLVPRPWRALASLLVSLSLLSGCAPAYWKGLQGTDFTDRSVAVVTTVAPPPLFFSDSDEEIDLDEEEGEDGPGWLGTVLKIGTDIYRGHQESGVAFRLDSASRQVDLPPRIADRVLAGGAEVLGARATDASGAADYHLEVRVDEWGIGTDDWESNPYFTVRATVLLLDGPTGIEVWRGEVEERDDISGTIFDQGTILGNVFTGRALGDLTTEEISRALEELADYTGDRLVVTLRQDLARARQEDARQSGERGRRGPT